MEGVKEKVKGREREGEGRVGEGKGVKRIKSEEREEGREVMGEEGKERDGKSVHLMCEW